MNERNPDTLADARLDDLLSSHFARELGPHAGGAARRFAADAETTPTPVLRLADRVEVRPRGADGSRGGVIGRIGWAVPLLAAAAAVAMVVVPVARMWSSGDDAGRGGSPLAVRPTPPAVNPPSIAPGDNAGAETVLAGFDPEVEGSVYWQYRDAGQVFLDDETAARQIIRTEYNTLEWVDPVDRSRVQVTVPRQEVVLIGAPRY